MTFTLPAGLLKSPVNCGDWDADTQYTPEMQYNGFNTNPLYYGMPTVRDPNSLIWYIALGPQVPVKGTAPADDDAWIVFGSSGGGGGGVSSVTGISPDVNGLHIGVTGSTSNAVITVSTTLTGVVKGNGTAFSAAVAGTDYVVPAGLVGQNILSYDPANSIHTDTVILDTSLINMWNAIASISPSSNWKTSAQAMATANVTVSNPGTAVFDGVTLTNGQRLFLKFQTAQAENGIYIFNGSGSALTRSTDMDNWAEVVQAVVPIDGGGTSYGNTFWLNTNNPGGTIGTTAITFSQITSVYTAGTGVTISGNIISIGQSVATGATPTFAGVNATTFTGALAGNATTATALASNLTQYQVLLGAGTGVPTTVSGVGTSGQFLTSQGAGSAPIWTTGSGGGGVSSVTGISPDVNGLHIAVANSTTTPVITVSTTQTGVLYGNGTAISGITNASGALVNNGSGTMSYVAYTNANTASTIVQRDSSGNFVAGTISAALNGTATLATYLAGGVLGNIPYQTAANTTAFLANGSGVLQNNGSGVLSWVPVSGTGTVTDFSFTNGNGFVGDVTNSTTTPTLELSTDQLGVLYANGTSMTGVPNSSGALVNDGSGSMSYVGYTNANTASTIVQRDSSGDFVAGTISADLNGTAALATSLAGGVLGNVPYQTAANTTAFLANSTGFLKNDGSGSLSWASAGGGSANGVGRYVVDQNGEAEYTTIQDAINQAITDGVSSSQPATVWIWEGTYIEDLTLAPFVNLAAAAPGEGSSVTIVGAATFSATGTNQFASFSNITFSATNGNFALTFSGVNAPQVQFSNCYFLAAATSCGSISITGAAFVIWLSCFYSTTSGNQTFNISNGDAYFQMIGCGGNTVFGGSRSTMSAGGFEMEGCGVVELYNLTGGRATITASYIYNPATVFTMASPVALVISASTVECTDASGYWATGTGALTASMISTVNVAKKAQSTLTFVDEGCISNNLSFDGGNTFLNTDGALWIGSSSGNPVPATLTAGAGIVIDNTGGGITISSDAESAGIAPYNSALTYQVGNFIAGDSTNSFLGGIFTSTAVTGGGAYDPTKWVCLVGATIADTDTTNLFVGTVTIPAVMTGTGLNTFIGWNAGSTPSLTGTGNFHAGVYSGASTAGYTGNYNAVTGNFAMGGNALTSASYNSGTGHNALFNITTGTYNTVLGYQAGYNVDEGIGNILINHPGTAGSSFNHNWMIYNPASSNPILEVSNTDTGFDSNMFLATASSGIGGPIGLRTMAVEDTGGLSNFVWNPADGSGATLTFTIVTSLFSQVFNIVTVQTTLTYPTTSDTSQAKIGGLPQNAGGVYNLIGIGGGLSFTMIGSTAAGDDTITLINAATGAAVTNVQLSGATISVSGSYAI